MTDDKEVPFYTPKEVQDLFRVDAKTVTRWADSRKLESFRTPGGQRRFPKSQEAFRAIHQLMGITELE